MVMKIDAESVVNLKVTIQYDDCTHKSQTFAEGDYIRVAYNHNGTRRVVAGTVSEIHANPYSAQVSKRDWYFTVIDEDPRATQRLVKVIVINILDLEVIHKKYQPKNVTTPNDPTRVTGIRVVNGYFQITQDEGRTWRTVDSPLTDRPIPPDDRLATEIMAMIGDDQYENADEFIKGIIELIHKESRRPKPWTEHPVDCPVDDGDGCTENGNN